MIGKLTNLVLYAWAGVVLKVACMDTDAICRGQGQLKMINKCEINGCTQWFMLLSHSNLVTDFVHLLGTRIASTRHSVKRR